MKKSVLSILVVLFCGVALYNVSTIIENNTQPNEDATAVLSQYGSRGDEVRQIQQRLKDLGYFTEEVTTFYGEVTEEAVSAFQYVASLSVTGEVDGATYELLFSDEAENYRINVESTEETMMEANVEEEAQVAEENIQEETTEATTEAPTTEAATEAPTTEEITEAPTTVQATTEVITEASKNSNEAMQSITSSGVASIGADVKNNGDFVKWFIIIAAVMAASFAFVVLAEKKRFSKARHADNENKRYK